MTSKHIRNSVNLTDTGMNIYSVWVSSNEISERTIQIAFRDVTGSNNSRVFASQELNLSVEQTRQAIEALQFALAESERMGDGEVFESSGTYDIHENGLPVLSN